MPRPEDPPTDRDGAIRLAAEMVRLLQENTAATLRCNQLLEQLLAKKLTSTTLPITKTHIDQALELFSELLMEEQPRGRRRR